MQQTIYAPYLRTSPVAVPRRDLVLAASDSLYLRVTVVESDRPDAQMLVLTGGLDGPQAQMVIWLDQRTPGGWCWHDYGYPPTAGGTVLWSGMGEPQIGLGSFDFTLPAGTFTQLPLRCGWAVQLGWSGMKSDVLFSGFINISAARFGPIPPTVTPIETDDQVLVLA